MRHGLNPQVGKIPWRRAWQPIPVSLPGESHRQRSLVGYVPLGSKELGHDRSNLVCIHVSLCTCQNGHHQKISKQLMLGKAWRKGNPPMLLVGV